MKQSPKPKKARKGKYGLAWTAVIAVYLILAIVVSCSFGLFDGLLDGFGSGSNTTLRDKDRDDDDDRKPNTTTAPTDPENPEPWYPTDPENPEPWYPTDPVLPEVPEKTVYTIKVWTPGEDQAYDNNWLKKMQQRFEDAHPEYDILWENEIVGEGDAGVSVIQDVTAAADVYMFPSEQLYKLIEAGGLGKLVGDHQSQILRDNSQLMIDSVSYADGNQYAFPIANNTWYLYYDKDVFTEEDVQNLDTMLEKGRVYLPMANAWSGSCFFLGTGGTIFGEFGKNADAGINFGGENGYKAAKKMVELKNNSNVDLGDLDISRFINGEVSATFSGSWVRGDLEAAFGDRLGVAMLPSFTIDGSTYQMKAMSSSKCVGVNPYAARTEGKYLVCTEFAAFLASEEAQLARYEMRGVIPAHKDLRYHPLIAADPVAVAEMDTITYASVLQPSLEEMNYYWGPLGNFCNKLCKGDITFDNYEIVVDDLMDSFENYYW